MSDKGYKIAPVMMTPQAAVCLLETNTANRHLRPSHVNYLVGTILRGEFRATNDAITVTSSGVLANGQHRLTAIVRAQTPAPVLLAAPSIFFIGLEVVEMNADDSLMAVMDCGIGRTATDRTGLPRKLCELVTVWLKEAHGRGYKPTADQIVSCYHEKKDMFDWAFKLRPSDRGAGIVTVWLAFMELYNTFPDHADVFVRSFVKQAPDIQQAYVLRSKLVLFSARGVTAGDGNKIRNATYRTAIACIKRWMKGEIIEKVYPCDWNNETKES